MWDRSYVSLPPFVRQVTWHMSHIRGSLDSEGSAHCTQHSLSGGYVTPPPACLAHLSRGIPNATPSVQPSLLHWHSQTVDCYQRFANTPVTRLHKHLFIIASFLDCTFFLRSHKLINIQIWKEGNARLYKNRDSRSNPDDIYVIWENVVKLSMFTHHYKAITSTFQVRIEDQT